MEIVGYHGTNEQHAKRIETDGFEIRDGKDLWYGPGAYFYGDVISSGQECAEKWAIAASRQKNGPDRYSRFAVLRVTIRASKPLDATTDDGKKLINDAREKIRKEQLVKNDFEDNKIIKLLVNFLKFDLVINDCYARFELERVYNIRSSVPNVRIIAVLRPESCIDKASIVIVKTGPIPPPICLPP